MEGWALKGKRTGRAVTWPKGFRAAGVTAGIKPSGKADLALLAADEPCAAAAVFTKNKIPGAPVVLGKKRVRSGRLQAVVVNSGISNVCTGQQGLDDAQAMCDAVAEHVANVEARDVLPGSTGVIGVPLPMDKVLPGIAKAAAELAMGPAADAQFAEAILTTDLAPKTATVSFKLGEQSVRIAAAAKGSGMIAPNMATMLAYLTTDIAIAPDLLKQALRSAVDLSFNRISVDSDTSTSDTVAILASGKAGNATIDRYGPDYEIFETALTKLCRDLAYQVIRDGEGVERVVRVLVHGAKSVKDANRVGRSIVNSPLVKTALHGADPNWGRLAMAVGKSGAKVKREKLSIRIGDVTVGRNGAPLTLNAAQRDALTQAMQQEWVTYTVNLHVGDANTDWLGCDLSEQYIRINADYTT